MDILTVLLVMSVVVDFMAVIIPVFAIRNLQMPLNTKISISIIMGLGLCTASISIGKVFAVRSIRDQTCMSSHPHSAVGSDSPVIGSFQPQGLTLLN